ncbi:MAG: hypothetical protein ACYSUT_03385 [Planctomycetota bacterium]|jgi:hypothetical protein
MNSDIVSAAKWFGFCLIVSSLVLVIGFFIIGDRCSRRMSSAIINAGGSRPVVHIPSSFVITHKPTGTMKVDLSPNNESININVGSEGKPLKLDIDEHNMEVRTNSPIQINSQ